MAPKPRNPFDGLRQAEADLAGARLAVEALERQRADVPDVAQWQADRDAGVQRLHRAEEAVAIWRHRAQEAEHREREHDRAGAVDRCRALDGEWLAVARELDDLLALVRAARAKLEGLTVEILKARAAAGLSFPTLARRAFLERSILSSVFGRMIADPPPKGSHAPSTYAEMAHLLAVPPDSNSREDVA